MAKQDTALPSDRATHEPSPDGLGHSVSVPSAVEDMQGAIAWCHHQAENIMGISSGCASTHGDPGGGLEMINSIASDIAINLQMFAEKFAQAIEAGTAMTEGHGPKDESAVRQDAPQTPVKEG